MSQTNLPYGGPSIAEIYNNSSVSVPTDSPTTISGSSIFASSLVSEPSQVPHALGHAATGAGGALLPPNARAAAGLGSSAYGSGYGDDKSGGGQ
jgi:hypothetical protein